MLKIGLLGTGHLGKIHLNCIKMVEQFEFIGFYDPDDQNAALAAETYSAKRWSNMDELIDAADVIDIVTPTITHFELAKKAIEKGKHVFIEKPLTHTLEEAEKLLELSKEIGVKIQGGSC